MPECFGGHLQVTIGVVGQNMENAVNHVEEVNRHESDKGLVELVQLIESVNLKIATHFRVHQGQVYHNDKYRLSHGWFGIWFLSTSDWCDIMNERGMRE